MRIALPALACLILTLNGVGCSSTPSAEQAVAPSVDQPVLEGTWTVDMDSFKSSEEYQSSPAETRPMIAAAMESVKFEFTSDTIEMSMSMFGQEQAVKSSYRIVGHDGQEVTVETRNEGEESKEAEVSTIVVILDGNTMIMPESGNQPRLMLRRKPAEEN